MMVTQTDTAGLNFPQFLTPKTVEDHRTSPVNALGYLRVMFRVDNLEELLAGFLKLGAVMVGSSKL